MDPLTISTAISIATKIIGLANKAIGAANSGDLDKAVEYLAESRSHYDISEAAWNAAEQHEENS